MLLEMLCGIRGCNRGSATPVWAEARMFRNQATSQSSYRLRDGFTGSMAYGSFLPALPVAGL